MRADEAMMNIERSAATVESVGTE